MLESKVGERINESLMKYINLSLYSNDAYVRYGLIKNVNLSLFYCNQNVITMLHIFNSCILKSTTRRHCSICRLELIIYIYIYCLFIGSS